MLLQRKEAEYFSNYLLKICFRTFRTAFISVLSLAIQNFSVWAIVFIRYEAMREAHQWIRMISSHTLFFYSLLRGIGKYNISEQ